MNSSSRLKTASDAVVQPTLITRRRFFEAASAGLALSTRRAYATGPVDPKPRRVGLIGAGWYGKSDLWRLIQVAPVEVVSICDPDKQMLAGAVEMAGQRQKSKKTPRTYGDYREMLSEKDLDIVLIGSPDHWHALHAIAAIEAGADVYLQKPISVDVLEGEAILAAARKHKRVVQIGTQRKSTPHLIDAKKQVVEAGLLGKIGHVDMCCYFHMRANGNPPVQPVPDFLDYEMWTGPAPLRPYDGLPHMRWWRTFMEYGNGIVGDMCVHMLDTVRWMLGLGWPKRISSAGGIYVQKEGKSNITDTQTADVRVRRLQRRLAAPHLGPADRSGLSVGAVHLRREGHAQGQHHARGLHPARQERQAHPLRVPLRAGAVSRGRDREGHRAERRARHAPAHARFPRRHRPAQPARWPTSSRATSRPPVASWPTSPCRSGRPLVYDPQTPRRWSATPEATRLLRRPYRAPWQHPEPGVPGEANRPIRKGSYS